MARPASKPEKRVGKGGVNWQRLYLSAKTGCLATGALASIQSAFTQLIHQRFS